MSKQGWTYKKLGEVVDFERGLTYKKPDEQDGTDVFVLRSNNIDLETYTLNLEDLKSLRPDFNIPSSKLVRKGTILICMSNGSRIHLGKVAHIDKDYNYAFGGFMGLIIPHSIDSKLLYYICRG